MKNTLKSRVTFLVCAAVLTLSSHAGAVSVNLIEATGTWISTQPTVTGVGTNTISWGDPATSRGPSQYIYETLAPELGLDLGEEFKIGKFIHRNNPIYAPLLEEASLKIDYEIQVVNGGVIGTFMGSSYFDFEHLESPNGANPCANGGANGSGINSRGCADRVTFTMNEALSDSFTVDGLRYELALTSFLLGDGTVADEFWTKEKKSNKAWLMATVTAVPLPAAGPLFASLLGLLGLMRMRRNTRELSRS